MILKFDHVPNPTWDIPSWIWDIILFGTLIIPNLIFRFGMSEIGIPVWDIPSRIWDIGRVWATTVLKFKSLLSIISAISLSFLVFCYEKIEIKSVLFALLAVNMLTAIVFIII